MAVHHTAYDDIDEREGILNKACERLIIPYRGKVYGVYVSPENSKAYDEALTPFIHAATEIKSTDAQFPKVKNPGMDFFEVVRTNPEYARPTPLAAVEAPGQTELMGGAMPGEGGDAIPEGYWEVAKTASHAKRQVGRRFREIMKEWAESQGLDFPKAGRINREIGVAFARANEKVVREYLAQQEGTP